MDKNKKRKDDDLASALDDLGDLDADLDADGLGMDDVDSSRDLIAHVRDKEFKSHEEAQEVVVSESLKAFKESAKNESELFLETCDTEYWVCLCFPGRNQKEEFLRQAGWLKFGDKYIDGTKVAQKMGFPLSSSSPRFIRQEREKSLTPSPENCIDPETARKSLKKDTL